MDQRRQRRLEESSCQLSCARSFFFCYSTEYLRAGCRRWLILRAIICFMKLSLGFSATIPASFLQYSISTLPRNEKQINKKKKETKHQKSSPRHIWLIFIGLAAEYKDAVADGLLMSLLLSYIYFVFKQLPFWVIIRIHKEPPGPR